ncbi:unnamed protein product [Discosporangium mesarthrocarpum]
MLAKSPNGVWFTFTNVCQSKVFFCKDDKSVELAMSFFLVGLASATQVTPSRRRILQKIEGHTLSGTSPQVAPSAKYKELMCAIKSSIGSNSSINHFVLPNICFLVGNTRIPVCLAMRE